MHAENNICDWRKGVQSNAFCSFLPKMVVAMFLYAREPDHALKPNKQFMEYYVATSKSFS